MERLLGPFNPAGVDWLWSSAVIAQGVEGEAGGGGGSPGGMGSGSSRTQGSPRSGAPAASESR